MNTFLPFVMILALGLGGIFGMQKLEMQVDQHVNEIVSQAFSEEAAPAFGGFTPAGGITYRLQSSIGTSNTSITLSSFKNRSNIALTMSVLNTDIGYATLDPQSSRSEFISFTGITQNSDGTATLTGVSRGLADIYPFTASSTMTQSHPGQSILILSDPPQLFAEYAVRRNAETISGDWVFTGQTTFSNFPITPSNSPCSETVAGVCELATGIEAASSTSSGSSGRLALGANLSTSTYNSATLAALKIPVTGNSGKLDSLFISTTTLFSFTLPTDRGASSSVAMSNGAGATTWIQPGYTLLEATTTSVQMESATSTFTPGGFENLFVTLVSEANDNTTVNLNFNSDAGANYGVASEEGNALRRSSAASTAELTTPLATTSSKMLQLTVSNPTSFRKSFNYKLIESSGTAVTPNVNTGGGIWNNTSAKISIITITGRLPSGTKISVYGF